MINFTFGSNNFASNFKDTEDGGQEHATFVVHVYSDDLAPLTTNEASLFENWLQKRFNNEDMKVFFDPPPFTPSVNEEVLGVSTTPME